MQSIILSFEERLYKIIYTEKYVCFIHQLTTDLSGVGRGKFDYFFMPECLYLEISHQWLGGGYWEKGTFHCNSIHLSVYIWRYCFSGGVGGSLTVLPHIWVSIFGNCVSVVGWGNWRGKSDCNSSCQVVYILKSCKFKIYLPQIVREGSPPLRCFSWKSDCKLWCMSNLITVSSCVRDISYEHLFLFLDDVDSTSTLLKKSGIALQMIWEMKWW